VTLYLVIQLNVKTSRQQEVTVYGDEVVDLRVGTDQVPEGAEGGGPNLHRVLAHGDSEAKG